MAKTKVGETERAVVICTELKGVFFGYTTDATGDPITLLRARMCVYWSADMKGIMGLASKGPSEGCKIGDAVPEIELRKITCVITCTEEAIKKWESNKWNP